MTITDAELKGSVLRGVLRDAKELPGGVPRLMERVPEEVRKAYFAHNIIHGSWYSYRAFAALLDAYSTMPGHGSAASFKRMGERLAERDFTTLFKAYAMVSSPQRLADIPRKIWVQRFRNAGTAESEPGDRNFRFTIVGFPDIHPMQCEALSGYGQAVGRRKTASFTTVHDRCVHQGGHECSWLSTW